MAKKIVIALAVLVFSAVIFMPEIAAFSAKKAFRKENRKQPWAPMTAYRAGKFNMRFWRYKAARKILEKTVKTFPTEIWVRDAYYQIAFCYEKSGELLTAIEKYEEFMTNYPTHVWRDQAAKRVFNIKANL